MPLFRCAGWVKHQSSLRKMSSFPMSLDPDAYGNGQRGLHSVGFAIVVLGHHLERFAHSAVVHQARTVYCSCFRVNDKVVSVVSSQRVLYFSVFSRVLVYRLKPKIVELFEKINKCLQSTCLIIDIL